MDDIINLNVGGAYFTTTRATLCAEAGSMLRAKFHPESNFAPPIQDKDGNYFLDRNPETFPYVLQYLRSKSVSCLPPIDKQHLIEVLQEEADYFGLDGLLELCKSNTNFGSSTMVVTKVFFVYEGRKSFKHDFSKWTDNGYRITGHSVTAYRDDAMLVTVSLEKVEK